MIEFMGKQLENPLIASSCIATESVSNVLRLCCGLLKTVFRARF